MKRKNTRSPLKAKPWRNPGQSLDEEIRRIYEESITVDILAAFFAVLLAVLEWYRWWRQLPYTPAIYTGFAIAVLAIVSIRFFRYRKKLLALKLGRDGEKAVGQYLDLVREEGHRVFHDIVADGFNIDHVIISRQGIFAVETKTYRKPDGEKAVIRIESNKVLVDGREPQRDAISQVLALADWLQTQLYESTGKHFHVRGILLYPGWWVEGKSHNTRLWVLNPRALPAFLKNERETLSEADVSLATYHLSRHIRST